MNRWDDLKLFLAVARAGTLSAAARQLGGSVSTMQRRVRALEVDVGAVLFQKGPRGYLLTAAGEALLPQAAEVEEAVLAASRAVVGHDQQASGEVRITAPPVFLPSIAESLAEFCRTYDRVLPVLLADDGILDLGRATDIAIRATWHPDESAVGHDICGLAWCRYASVHTTGEALPWIRYLGLASHPAILWAKLAFPARQTRMVVSGVAGMQSVLASSGAQSLLPCFLGDAHPDLRRIGDPVAQNRLWLLMHADLRRSARIRAVIDFMLPRIRAARARYEGVL